AVGALATSMAGALGAGVALAGTIGTWVGAIVGGAIVGALSGLTIQVGNNLIDMIGNGPFSWDRATRGWKQAVIAGAIGGALGGLGGQLGQMLVGRLATVGISSGWQMVAEFGVNMAFDTIGGMLGDLANGNPITLEGVLQGALIGAVVQVSFIGIGRMARSGEAALEGGRAATRMQRLAMGIEGIQKGSMGFGERMGGGLGARFGGPSAEWSSRAMAVAREAMAPRRPQSGTSEEPGTSAGRTGDEAAAADASTSTRPTEETGSTPRPTEETSTPRPMDETSSARPTEEGATTRPADETTTRPAEESTGTRPDEPTTRPAEESEGIVKPNDLEEGIAAQRDLPNGHKERINENLDPEGCSSCDLLKRRYEEMFRRGQIEMDESEFSNLMGEFDRLKTDLIERHGDAILDTPTEANRGDIINGRTRQEIYDDYLRSVTDIENRVLGNVRNRSLIVGEGTFEYTNALRQKLAGTTEAPNPGGHDITATGYQSRAEMEAINAKYGIDNPPQAGRVPLDEGPSLSIEHGVDAMALGDRYPANSFDRIIYNNPEVPGDEMAMRRLLTGVLESAPTVLRPGGELQIGLTGSDMAKGRVFLDGLVRSGGPMPRGGRPVTIEFNGRRYSVRILPETEFTAPYRGRKTEGSGLRNAMQPKRYYVFKPL
ncbi:MAG: DUF2431 domain-containing protein, partial [Chitinophagaceae bacterium]|nr:DUF2431 domain-containing protein [Chitinophagaceae bacterium]